MAKRAYSKEFEKFYRRCKALDGWPHSKYDQESVKWAMHCAWQARGRYERACQRSIGRMGAPSSPVATYTYPLPSARGLT